MRNNHVIDHTSEEFQRYMFLGEFGLERECLRITMEGNLAQTPHPFADEAFGRDFAECQLELVTPVCHFSRQLYNTLLSMHKSAAKILSRRPEPEYLWLYSNPPAVSGEIPIARFSGNLHWKEEYRRHLAEVYGRQKMLYSGIHYNFSFPREILPEKDRDRLYLNLAKRLYEHAWLPVLLMAASPVYDASFFGGQPHRSLTSEYGSMRCGPDGYWNKEELYLDFTSVEGYAASLQRHIREGRVVLPSEIYLPVRLKAAGDNSMERLLSGGIAYVEFRMLDINPFDEAGIDYRDLEFLHMLMIYLTFLEDDELTEKMQAQAIADIRQAALLQPPAELIERALALLADMEDFFAREREVVADFLDFQREKLNHPAKRYASRVIACYARDYTKEMTLAMVKGSA